MLSGSKRLLPLSEQKLALGVGGMLVRWRSQVTKRLFKREREEVEEPI